MAAQITKKAYRFDGKLYTISELMEIPAVKESGVDRESLRITLAKGMTVEGVLARRRSRAGKYEHNGKSLSLRDWSREPECVVSYSTLYTRVARGRWKIGDALAAPAAPAPQKKFLYGAGAPFPVGVTDAKVEYMRRLRKKEAWNP